MPLRAKLKRAIGRNNSSSASSDLAKSETNKSSKSKKPKKEKYPDNVYKPGEPMPRPKYRGPYNQAHQDKLKAFNFGEMWNRRRSSATGNSDISPMGSRAMSRRGSAWSRRSKIGSRQGSGFAGVEEGEAEDDTTNVGLSRKNTAENRRPGGPWAPPENDMTDLEAQKTVVNGVNGDTYGLDKEKTITNGTNGRLFTEDELASAMTRSTLKPSRRERS
ncbi:hypothetical protein ACLMJK_002373 [Lecanora helva]